MIGNTANYSTLLIFIVSFVLPFQAQAFFDDFLYSEFARMERVSDQTMQQVIRELRRQRHLQQQQQEKLDKAKTPSKNALSSSALTKEDKVLQVESSKAFWKGDYATVLKIQTKLSFKGIPAAFDSLGTLYESGRGVEKNIHQAFAYYYEAYRLNGGRHDGNIMRVADYLANQGDIKATKISGLLHLRRAEREVVKPWSPFQASYVQTTIDKSTDLLTRAYNMGDIGSAIPLASIYNNKKSFPKSFDQEKHKYWLNKAQDLKDKQK